MSRNYKFADPEGLYFVSFVTVHWIGLFVRRVYFDCLVENLNHCVDEKGMEIFACPKDSFGGVLCQVTCT